MRKAATLTTATRFDTIAACSYRDFRRSEEESRIQSYLAAAVSAVQSMKEIEAMNFSGKVALVTGAGSPQGIGFATARLLAQQGSTIAITSTTERIEARARELAAEGAEVFALPADLRITPALTSWCVRFWPATDASTFWSTMPA